jgi:hypothetical protein
MDHSRMFHCHCLQQAPLQFHDITTVLTTIHLHNLTIIQPSDFQFILLFTITQQVIHTQSTAFQVPWKKCMLKHKIEKNLN